MRMVQVLPVNDTSVYGMWWDSYPYSTVSTFALHPIYLRVQALARGGRLPREAAQKMAAAQAELEGEQVDYVRVMEVKRELVELVYDLGGSKDLEGGEFQAWFELNKTWLEPYAVFCYLKDLFGTSEHWQWGVMANPSPELITKLTHPSARHHKTLRITYYSQYHLHCQLSQVSQYAESMRVLLKGDLPIGVDKRSVDTWMYSSLFRMDKSTGAPPDIFSPTGQNWGFPTYNWEEMSKDGYLWWRQRLSHMAQYFHAYRIDHVLGFFRIWEVPGYCVTGLLGHFRPALPVPKGELEVSGIHDFARLTEPYVMPKQLEQEFGEEADEVGALYFVEQLDGSYGFRPKYTTERDIMEIPIADDLPDRLKDKMQRRKEGLLRLRQNVLLLRDEADPEAFHPRFNLMETSSFRELNPSWQQKLRTLHDLHFFQRQEHLWKEHALRTLPVLMNSSDMLVCGEDLGLVPACVPPTMQELGLVGLRIQRMPVGAGAEFNDPGQYPYLVVASPSCHDVSTTRAWYEEDPDRAERFYFHALDGPAAAPPVKCTPAVARAVMQQHVESPAVLAIFPMQDLFALKEQYATRPPPDEIINDPTVPKHYWRYRIHVCLEDLIKDPEFIDNLARLSVEANRATLDELAEAERALSGLGA